MGSGKSTVGKKLAHLLEYNFVDLDQQIERDTGQSVASIFEEYGETYFRTLEQNWLKNTSLKHTVVSLGGGTPCFHNNMSLIKDKGVSVYLQLSVKALTDRLAQSKTIRPIIEPYKNDLVQLEQKVTDLLAARIPFYDQADLTFGATNMSAQKYQLLLDAIINLIGE